MRMDSLPIDDYHDIVNALGLAQPPLPPVPSTVSFDVRWQGKAAPRQLRDTANGFAGVFIDSNATIAWSANQLSSNFAFSSEPADRSTTISGVLGHELNGRFFKPGRP